MAKLFFTCLGAACLAACADIPRDAALGDSVRQLMAAQRISTTASSNAAAGLDGHAARGAQERYERSFTQAPAATPSPGAK